MRCVLIYVACYSYVHLFYCIHLFQILFSALRKYLFIYFMYILYYISHNRTNRRINFKIAFFAQTLSQLQYVSIYLDHSQGVTERH